MMQAVPTVQDRQTSGLRLQQQQPDAYRLEMHNGFPADYFPTPLRAMGTLAVIILKLQPR